MAWILDLTMPLILAMVVGLIVYPPLRPILFPPVPLALVDSSTGGIQTPSAGVLGSHDSATGAPENHRGEAVEQEAQDFVAGFASIAMSSAAGKHGPADPKNDRINSSIPDPTDMVFAATDAQSNATSSNTSKPHDKTKKHVQDAMWSNMTMVMRIVEDVADNWERFAK